MTVRFELLLQQSLSPIVLCLLATACSSGKKANCGSSPTAVLASADLVGDESGLLGGVIKVTNGRSCSVVLDIKSPGPIVAATAWTSKHCSVDKREDQAIPISVFHHGGYTQISAYAAEDAAANAMYAPLAAIGTKQVLVNEHSNKFFQNSGQLANGGVAECAGSDFGSTFCAAMQDTVVFDLAFVPVSIDSTLMTLFSESFKKREQIRNAGERASGVAGSAARLSAGVVEYWQNKNFYKIAPLVDLWMTCSSPALKEAFLADTRARNKNAEETILAFADEGGDSVLSDIAGWNEDLVEIWGRLDTKAYLDSCRVSGQILAEMKNQAVFGKTAWSSLQESGLVSGESISPGAKLNSYSSYLIGKEKTLREKLLGQWASLGGSMIRGSDVSDFFAHTNLVSLKSKDGLAQSGSMQFSGFSLGSEVMAGTSARLTASGISFQRNSQTPLTFKNGDSGTLFSYKGQFPLLTLNSVDGNGTSGGAAALPLPARPAGSSASAPAPVERNTAGQPNNSVVNSTSSTSPSVIIPSSTSTSQVDTDSVDRRDVGSSPSASDQNKAPQSTVRDAERANHVTSAPVEGGTAPAQYARNRQSCY